MLSLSPRYDLFRFVLPKDFLPDQINQKYEKILNENSGVIISPIDYLNESIKGITIPGISDINIIQPQAGGFNANKPENYGSGKGKLGRINIEPKHDMVYTSTENPLEKIDKEFRITFRMNQGLYNYFMIYETIFFHICKTHRLPPIDVLYIEILDETGNIISKIFFKDVYVDGIDGLDFSYDKIERDSGTFEVTFKFNNIDFEFIDVESNKIKTITK